MTRLQEGLQQGLKILWAHQGQVVFRVKEKEMQLERGHRVLAPAQNYLKSLALELAEGPFIWNKSGKYPKLMKSVITVL